MTMFVPILENVRQRFIIQDITVQPEAANSPGAQKLEFILRTESGPVQMILPLSEASLLMSEIGRALDEVSQTALPNINAAH